MEKKIEIGQKVYLQKLYLRHGESSDIEECTIDKIGKKFFYIKDRRFFIETLLHDGGKYSSSYKAYLSIEEYDNKVTRSKYIQRLNRYFSYERNVNLTLPQLEEIIKTIESFNLDL